MGGSCQASARHRRMEASCPIERSRAGETDLVKATELTAVACAVSTASGVPSGMRHTRAVPSIAAETSHVLHGETAISVISPVWPRHVCCR